MKNKYLGTDFSKSSNLKSGKNLIDECYAIEKYWIQSCKIFMLFMMIFGFSLPVYTSAQQFVSVIKKQKGIEPDKYYPWGSAFKLDYYELYDSFEGDQYDCSRLYFTFSPSPSKYNGSLIFFLLKNNIWIQDQKGKIYFARDIINDGSLPVWDKDRSNNAKVFFYTEGGDVRFSLNFDPLPDDVQEFDIYYNDKLWFSGVKLKPETDIAKFKTKLSQYTFNRINIGLSKNVNCSIRLNDKISGEISGRIEGDDCYEDNTVSFLFPAGYKYPVNVFMKTLKNASAEQYETNFYATPDNTCVYYIMELIINDK